jgi:hypothetical protein
MMNGLVAALLGVLLGVLATYWWVQERGSRRRRQRTHEQGMLILEKIKSVCKLVTVEGDFAEIYRYEHIKDGFMNILSSKKKALIIINAKAQVGYDLKKMRLQADESQRTIRVESFPQPELLSVSPNLQFYDIKNGLFNSFSPDDLTELNQRAREYIEEKIPDSSLMHTARSEALQAIQVIEKIVGTIGWTLDYSSLELTEEDWKFLKPNGQATNESESDER